MSFIERTKRYTLDDDYICRVGPEFGNQQFKDGHIDDGWLTIYAGYTWNGCSPTLSVLGLFLIGTPDGHVDYVTGKPHTYYASLVHDFLCRNNAGKRKHRDLLFKDMLYRFPLQGLYYFGVRFWAFMTWQD